VGDVLVGVGVCVSGCVGDVLVGGSGSQWVNARVSGGVGGGVGAGVGVGERVVGLTRV
jgi:hypothetical protein